MKIPEKIVKKIMSGEMRRKYGLDTSTGSMYYQLRFNKGEGDLEAQYEVYRVKGLLK